MALFSSNGKLWLSLVTTVVMMPFPAQAQIVPDDTLGAESSSLMLDQLVRGETADLIDGGALRGSNLFHSFGEFNVADGQRVYFANPADVESILSRVTGENPSKIFGTLGVDGPASLFLINPHGLVFGENARLDIEGSFYGTTADGVDVGGEVFSAVAPDQRGLLSVDPNTVFWNYLTAGEIVNRGALAAGGDLMLAGENLDLQHQVAALGDVSLLATESIKIRDTAEVPFVVLAGEELLVQGNQQVDIVALSHADSGLFSYGDMVLRSAERVGGDAHYLSGGSFRVEQLDGSGGELYSPIDPIIRSQGDVSFSAYLGASLHILAGGAVDIGTILITGPDLTGTAVNPITTPELATIELSDGTTLTIDGSTRPTVDIRAGVDSTAIGDPLGTLGALSGTFFDATLTPILPPGNNLLATSANITLGDVVIDSPNGLVLLTNQYQPTDTLTGDILVNGEGVFGAGIDVRNLAGIGGAVYLDARNDIDVLNSAIATRATVDVQDIVLIADGVVTFDSFDGIRTTGAYSNLAPEGVGSAGNIRITATGLNVLNGAQLNSLVFGSGEGGDVILNILETARFEGSDSRNGSSSGIFIGVAPNGNGTGGNVHVKAQNLEVLNGAQLDASVFGNGNAGSVTLSIEETARFEGSNPIVRSRASGALSTIQSNGNGASGDVHIQASNLEVLNGARLSASAFGGGNAGSVILLIEETARFEGSNPINNIASGASSSVTSNGDGGDVRIQSRNLEVINGAQLNVDSFGNGDAGSVVLLIEETARFEGSNPMNDSPSRASSSIGSNGDGTGGDVRIQANNLEVLNGAQLIAGIFGTGNAGNVILQIEETARFDGINPRNGSSSGGFSDVAPNANGMGGDVRIQANNLEVLNGAQLSAGTRGTGNAGNVILQIEETARFKGINPIVESAASGAFSSIQPNGEGNGGDIRIDAQNLEVLDGAGLGTSSFGQGNAGNIILTIEETARFQGTNSRDGSPAAGASSSIESNGEGMGGNVRIQARNLDVLDGAQLSAGISGRGTAGNIILLIKETARFQGIDARDGNPSGAFSSVQPTGEGTGGDVRIQARNLEVLDGAQLSTGISGRGTAGNIILLIKETARFQGIDLMSRSHSGAFSSIQRIGEGTGGNIQLRAENVEINNEAGLSSASVGQGSAGNIILTVRNRLVVRDGDIETAAVQDTGGQIQIDAGTIFLFGDSDIRTFVNSGENDGGNITIRANALVALDDSDILSFAADGRGGDIDLSQTAFFGQNFQFAPRGTDPRTLDNNDRVDINATGGIASGIVSLADVSFVEDSLNELPDNLVNPETLAAGSCVARSNDTDSSFTITGSDGLREQPSNSSSTYSLESVQSIPDDMESALLAEPQGTYRLTDGRLVLGRECNTDGKEATQFYSTSLLRLRVL